MLDRLRLPFFILAIVLIALALLAEAGLPLLLGGGIPKIDGLDFSSDQPSGKKAPGIAIFYTAPLDALVLYTVLLMGMPLVIPERLHGRIQGLATLILSFLLLLAEIVLIILAVVFLIIMVTLLLAPIFGAIAYFALFADFDRSGAKVILSLAMTLKLAFAVCLGLAHQDFIKNKGLVLIVVTTLAANLIVAFLHGFVPGFLVSITDALAAIVVGILAAIWAIVFLIGSIPSIFKVLRVDRALS